MLYLIMNYSKYFKFIKHDMLNTLMWTKFTICRQDYQCRENEGKDNCSRYRFSGELSNEITKLGELAIWRCCMLL